MKTLKEALFSRKNVKANLPKTGDNMYNYFLTLYNNGGITSHIIVYCEDVKEKKKDVYVISPVDDKRYCKKVLNNFCNFRSSTGLNAAVEDSINQHFIAISTCKSYSSIGVVTSYCSFASKSFEGFNDFFKGIKIMDYEFLKFDLSKEEEVEELKNKIIIPYL